MITVVVGGQFGSEGKGKIAHWIARRGAAAAVRVGGSNSGHTVVGWDNRLYSFRHLPTAALLDGVLCVLPAGSYLDADVLVEEIERVGLTPDRLAIDPNAQLITEDDRESEKRWGLKEAIGSTGSGTGAAVARRVSRRGSVRTVRDDPRLAPFVAEAVTRLRGVLDADGRIVIEGTQGFGLSVLHSPYYPNATSRDTTAAAAVAEAGLSPLDVDEVVLVLRAYPIRVAGDSGPLPHETDWDTITQHSGSPAPILERTTVTGRVRRVGEFDSHIARLAIAANQPTMIVMNHVDYVDAGCASGKLSPKASEFLRRVSCGIDHSIDYVGVGPAEVVPVAGAPSRVAAA
ncbi:MAG: adenylosuccinate synthetase [Actinomycetota bacterium]